MVTTCKELLMFPSEKDSALSLFGFENLQGFDFEDLEGTDTGSFTRDLIWVYDYAGEKVSVVD